MIAVTGYQGRLGLYLVNKYNNCVPLECDVTKLDSVKRAVDIVQPESIVHCAAVTDVDACESVLYDRAMEVNIRGTKNVRSAFKGQIIYISTDYVFDGLDGPYNEEAKPNPKCHYGYTKAMGEEEILLADYPKDVIVRTTILYGGHKPDFVTSILEKLKTNEMFRVTGALLGSPTYIPHLANGLRKLLQLKRPPRFLNIVGEEVISRWVFAGKIAKTFGYPVHNVLLTMISQSGVANRPRLAGLKTTLAKTIKVPIYSVDEGLKEYKEKMENVERI
jgi:dTDP-4-dehydrorhamnose reductase